MDTYRKKAVGIPTHMGLSVDTVIRDVERIRARKGDKGIDPELVRYKRFHALVRESTYSTRASDDYDRLDNPDVEYVRLNGGEHDGLRNGHD